ncbi:MAG: PAS domain S-box protein [Myxococcales bacterium]
MSARTPHDDETDGRDDVARRLVLENAPDAVIGVDGDDVIVDWNRQAETTFGWKRDEAVGRRLGDLIVPPELRDAYRRDMQRSLVTRAGPGLNRRVELPALGRSGARLFIERTIIPLFVGGELRIYSFIRDISEQRRIAAEFELIRDALDNSPNGFDIVDAVGRFVYANRAYLQMWGYEALEEIIGTSPAGHCADPSTPERIIRTVRERGVCEIEFVARRKDGSTFDVQMFARLARDANGNEIYPTTSLDITDRKRTEAALRYQSELTRAITDNAASCLFMIDERGHPTFMNPAASRVTGYRSLDEIKDRPLHDALHWKRPDGSRYPMEECPIDRAQAGMVQVQNQEEHFCRKDGTLFPVSYSLAPLERDGEVIGAVLEFRDITQQKQAEIELQNAIRSRDEFLSIASHELKTPLTSLKLQAQVRARSLERGELAAFTPERLKKSVEHDVRRIDRISRLVDDMLDIARITSGKLHLEREQTDLCALVREVVERFSLILEATATPMHLESCDAVVGEWDRFRLEQVVTNLLTNAVRYGAGRPLRVEIGRAGPYAYFSVRDQGIGIAPEAHERIFLRFERAVSANDVSGLGLGLYISRQIVEMHGGRILVESDVGKGATFRVELPLRPTS